jgi:hypothetical protein
MHKPRLIAAAAGLAAIVGVSALAFRADDYTERVNEVLSDAGMSRTEGAERLTDLMTEPVAPGATITTGVMLPLGWRASDVDTAGMFEVQTATHEDRKDGTWLEVTARNRAGAPMRFVAFITYSLPATDGGL